VLESSIDKHISELVSLLGRKYISTPTSFPALDLATVAQFFTMDVITDLAFGEEFGFLAKDEDVYEYCAAVKQMMPVMDAVTLFPRLIGFFQTKFAERYILPTENDPTGLGKVIGFVIIFYRVGIELMLI
jgi:hypothetical protein